MRHVGGEVVKAMRTLQLSARGLLDTSPQRSGITRLGTLNPDVDGEYTKRYVGACGIKNATCTRCTGTEVRI